MNCKPPSTKKALDPMLIGDAQSGFSFISLTIQLDEIDTLVKERDNAYADPPRKVVEQIGRNLLVNGTWSRTDVDRFVEAVFRWGKGDRNLARVKNSPQLAELLRRSSDRVGRSENDAAEVADAIWELSDNVQQLGPSFASKLLRFLYPNDVVIYDSIIRTGLGLPEEPRGYIAFHNACKTIQDGLADKGTHVDLSDVEAAVFMKLRKKTY